MKSIQYLPILILTMILSGCVSMRGPHLSHVQKRFTVHSRQQVVASLKKVNAWQADGAFSFDSAQQVGIANFRIDVTPFTWRVHISSGLNMVQMTIGSDALGVWYTDQHGKIQHAQSLQDVMKAQFGFALPVDTLVDWMKGLPATTIAKVTLNAVNQLQSLTENGWQLLYSQYGLYDDVSLPGQIDITGHGEKIKMVIRHWQIKHG